MWRLFSHRFTIGSQMHRPETQALFFRAVADRQKIPVLLYNIPQVTGYDLPADNHCRVFPSSEHHRHEGQFRQSGKNEETLRVIKPGFQILSGRALAFGEALKIGASGAILAIANALPYACVTIWEAFRTRE